ncbi:Fungal transcriptional regulatory protein [Cordyceps militaris CM01]|uniref:Fungal transcriptional regulatory protein n=1 Tax=Cordyceps militaris (strain CM01) TaxID=983644 RepID=G3JTL9_CORMM|nr:Fungal transcriptional regulatory protein [Cordyceps militaris CM01]EGX88023.1 Fungal transcriptional regulatory protein [Cordyceps militaris CM01]
MAVLSVAAAKEICPPPAAKTAQESDSSGSRPPSRRPMAWLFLAQGYHQGPSSRFAATFDLCVEFVAVHQAAYGGRRQVEQNVERNTLEPTISSERAYPASRLGRLGYPWRLDELASPAYTRCRSSDRGPPRTSLRAFAMGSASSPKTGLKQAACLVCRRGKIKCEYLPDQGRCRRCLQLDSECVRPDYHAGRQRGIKNKRVGIDKAIYQVHQAARRAGKGGHGSKADAAVLARLRDILHEAEADGRSEISPSNESQRTAAGDEDDSMSDGEDEDDEEAHADEDDEDDDAVSGTAAGASSRHGASMSASASAQEPEPDPAAGYRRPPGESLAVDGAENPLQLLARASYFTPSAEERGKRVPPKTRQDAAAASDNSASEHAKLNDFFSITRSDLDVGDDIDPISLGLVEEDEAEMLFTFFHEKLAHTRWGLDPDLYTVSFTRTRSAFLTTTLMACAALFVPTAGSLSKRLSNHVKTLAQRVITRRHRSVEIVLAFVVNIPWIFPGQRSTDDETCWYISMAATIAIDLLMHKTLVARGVLDSGAGLTMARGECLDTGTALEIDGYEGVEPWSERGMILLRSRERCWISLYVVERGIQDAIERFFAQWHSKWDLSIGVGPDRRLPPYVEILVSHTRLSTYGGVINHPTAPIEVRRFFRTAGLSSALNVMRAAIQGESLLQSMPNNTTIMICFAACFALTLSAYTTDRSALAPSIRELIVEAAGVLERLGTITPHRHGLSVLYGKYLRQIVRKAAGSTKKGAAAAVVASVPPPPPLPPPPVYALNPAAATTSAPLPSPVGMPAPDLMHPLPQHQHHAHQMAAGQQPMLWPETLQFSAMSGDQITHVLNQPGNAFEPSFGGLSWQDMNNFDWLPFPEFGM